MRPLRQPIRDAQRTALPPRFGFVDTEQASGLVPSKGLYRCGTVPGLHRTSLSWLLSLAALPDLPAQGITVRGTGRRRRQGPAAGGTDRTNRLVAASYLHT